MFIEIDEISGLTVKLTVGDIKGLHPNLTIEGEIEPGQTHRRPTMKDEIGQEGLDASFEITSVHILLKKDYLIPVELVQVEDELIADDFYSEIMEELEKQKEV